MHTYYLNGKPVDVLGGDWFVGKGAAHLVLLHPTLGQVQVFNTHLRTPYPLREAAKGAEPHQVVNAWEFARLARTAAELGRYVICVRSPFYLSK
jgi:sphingomyelin phosphodiesterase 2